MKSCSVHTRNLRSPSRWGLPAEVVDDLGARLQRFWQRLQKCFTTRTRDPAPLAFDYLRALLTIERGGRNARQPRAALIWRRRAAHTEHFMSNSPWSGPAVLEQTRREIVATPELNEGGTLILDFVRRRKIWLGERRRPGTCTTRMGSIDLCRVDACLTYANLRRRLWTMIDGELFVARHWFADEHRSRRERAGIPAAGSGAAYRAPFARGSGAISHRATRAAGPLDRQPTEGKNQAKRHFLI